MYGRHCSQAIPAFAIQSCVLATKLHMLNFCEACAAICCHCDLREPITQGTKRFLSFEKTAKLRTKQYNGDFRKVVITTQYQIRYAIYTPPNTKDLAINMAMVAYGNRSNVITFALRFVTSTEAFNGNRALYCLTHFVVWL